MKWILLMLTIAASTLSFGQGRTIDLSIHITDPAPGDSFVSPSKKTVTVFLINNGPDTIIPKDEFHVEFIFSAFHIFPKFLSFQSTVLPGDSFKYQRELDIDYSGDVASMKFCAEAFAYSKGRDSIKTETGIGLKNNKHCVTTTHIDSAKNSSITSLNHNKASIFPNPTSDQVSITSQEVIQSCYITDLKGRLVQTHSEVNTSTFTLDFKPFSPGIYFVTINSNKGVYTEKVIRTQ